MADRMTVSDQQKHRKTNIQKTDREDKDTNRQNIIQSVKKD